MNAVVAEAVGVVGGQAVVDDAGHAIGQRVARAQGVVGADVGRGVGVLQ